ncbi:hypothetical protein GCM10010411_76760 [Actinomadura fulvescens]|uniref:Uncharacterized protein n=1 Tax=Actinomadura fulvescens TaxID=46160 RepID=A0ABN3QJL5_9ACTN
MRLYDWLIDPSEVWITRQEGRTYATDRYLVVDCSVVTDEDLPDVGVWTIKKTKPATRVDRFDQESAEKLDPKMRLTTAVQRWTERPDDYHVAAWSDWTMNASHRLGCRIGALGKTPVAVNHAWLSKAERKHRLVGNDPHRHLLISTNGRPSGVVGLVLPVRLTPSPVHQAIVKGI